MAVLINAPVVLYQQISQHYGKTVNATNATLTNARVAIPEVTNRNTTVDLTLLDTGEVRVYHYNRLALDSLDFVGESETPLYLIHHDTVHEMFEELYKWTGFHFTEDDVFNHPVIDNGDGTYSMKIECKDGSLLWTGEVTLHFRDMPGIDGNLFISHNGGYI